MKEYILSVDGGGIRGIIPAIILAEIEKRTRKRVAEIFDLIAALKLADLREIPMLWSEQREKFYGSAS